MKTIFVLTIKDVVGLIALVLVILFFVASFAISVFKDWKRNRIKKTKETKS